MRQVTAEQNATAQRAITTYAEFSKPYVRRNGWTVIPADAPRPMFEGAELTTDRLNAFSTDVELYSLAAEKPAAFTAYVHFPRNGITTWTGEEVGFVVDRGAWHRNNLGARWRQVRVRAAWGNLYAGREYDSRRELARDYKAEWGREHDPEFWQMLCALRAIHAHAAARDNCPATIEALAAAAISVAVRS